MENDILRLITEGSFLQIVTYFTFMVTFIGMAAGSFFFALERGSMPERYRESVAVTALILAIAAINYYYMQGIYKQAVLNNETAFPTVFRYIDWILTTPLMLLKFPLLLGMGKKGRAFLTKLIIIDLAMVLFAFAGELLEHDLQLHYALFGIACLCWAIIVYMIFTALQQLPDWVPDSTRKAISLMGKFIFFGWMIYPIGYLMPSFSLQPEVRELLYNVGDLVNKVGLGLVVYAAALAYRKEMAAAALEDDEDGDDAYQTA
jgi:bacteriorhodopsin